MFILKMYVYSLQALSDPSSRLSTSPPPPAIAVPLLEMGFSLRQIMKALEATGRRILIDTLIEMSCLIQNFFCLLIYQIRHSEYVLYWSVGARAEADAQNITVLAMWMIDHPGTADSEEASDPCSGAAGGGKSTERGYLRSPGDIPNADAAEMEEGFSDRYNTYRMNDMTFTYWVSLITKQLKTSNNFFYYIVIKDPQYFFFITM